eukprot:767895-Hanusia_phi.AAC.3
MHPTMPIALLQAVGGNHSMSRRTHARPPPPCSPSPVLGSFALIHWVRAFATGLAFSSFWFLATSLLSPIADPKCFNTPPGSSSSSLVPRLDGPSRDETVGCSSGVDDLGKWFLSNIEHSSAIPILQHHPCTGEGAEWTTEAICCTMSWESHLRYQVSVQTTGVRGSSNLCLQNCACIST